MNTIKPIDNRIAIRGRINNIDASMPTRFRPLWQRCKVRFDLYGPLTSNQDYMLPRFDDWLYGEERLSKIAVSDRLEIIELAITNLSMVKKSSAGNKAGDVEKILETIIITELQQLEVEQLMKLQKDQDTKREELKEAQEELKQHIKKLAELNVLDYDKLFPTTSVYDRELRAFFDMYAEKLSIDTKLRIMLQDVAGNTLTKAIDTNKALSLPATILGAIKDISSGAQSFINAMGGFFTAIPIISELLMSVSSIYELVKTWFKSKSTAKKSFAVISVVVFIGVSAIVAGLFPVSIPIITLGVAAYGMFISMLKPWYQLQNKLKSRISDIKQVHHRLALLSKNKEKITPTERDELGKLTVYEKHQLTIALEQYAITHSDGNRNQALQLIQSGNIDKINQNDYIQAAIRHNRPQISSLHDFLIHKGIEREIALRKDIHTLRKAERKKMLQSINGLFAFAGLLLIFIPTPPTIIIGASLLGVSTLIGLGIKYNAVSHCKSLLRKIGIMKAKPDAQSEIDKQRDLHPAQTPRPATLSAARIPRSQSMPEIRENSLNKVAGAEQGSEASLARNADSFLTKRRPIKTVNDPVIAPSEEHNDETPASNKKPS